jgi:hypothetical protein
LPNYKTAVRQRIRALPMAKKLSSKCWRIYKSCREIERKILESLTQQAFPLLLPKIGIALVGHSFQPFFSLLPDKSIVLVEVKVLLFLLSISRHER